MDFTIIADMFWIVGVPVFRSVAGWATKALEDNVISQFEWKELAVTVSRVGTVALVAYLGFNSFGIDVSGLAAGCGAFLFDKMVEAIKGKKKVTA